MAATAPKTHLHWMRAGLEQIREGARPGERAAFSGSAQALVHRVARCKGVTCAAVAHEGLVVAHAGRDSVHYEALCAAVQRCAAATTDAAYTVSLGSPSHLVVVGSEYKLAVVPAGRVCLGILCPVHISLAAVLADTPTQD